MICQKFKYVYHYPCYKNSKVCTRFFVKNKSIWSTLCSLYYLVVEIDYMSFDKEIDRQGSLSLPAGNAKKCLDAISILQISTMRGMCGAACLLHKVDIYANRIGIDTSYSCQPGAHSDPWRQNFFRPGKFAKHKCKHWIILGFPYANQKIS